ncbi:MAG TPA: ABC transporter ATP-binding protein [Clostridiales bacterium]|nr:ABC transporter ATP-binding protein [Clostridiales bacterium]
MKELKGLMRFVKPYRWWVVLATFCMIFVTVMSMAGPWAIRRLIATIEEGVLGTQDGLRRVGMLALTVVIIYILRAVSRFGTNYVSHYSAWNILDDIRSTMYNHIQKLSMKYFNDKQTGELMSRVINDTNNFEQLLAHAIPTIIVNGFMFIGISVLLFTMNSTLALYTLIPIPLLAWMVLKFSKSSRPRFSDAQDKIANVNSVLQDNFTGIKEIKAFSQEEHESNKTSKHINAYTKAILRALRLSNSFHPGIELVSGLGTIIVIFFGGRLALTGQMPISDLVAFLMYVEMFYQPIISLGNINEGIQHALASAEKVLKILNEKPEAYGKPGLEEIDRCAGDIEFKSVCFRYNDKIPVLNNISFKVKSGETLALVGATGVGKTTIASLIPRFYDVDSGEICIDNINIQNITLESLRRQISLVSQDVFLFNGTVRENILYGNPEATEEELVEAAKTANAHDFILELENGYDTKVGERGVKLSGGQKQRISIARALLKDAPILILDEATSSVDTQTEKMIQDALNHLKENKTSIVIAHRLSTIREADQIIVLKDGEVLECGRHDELLQHNGLYTRLCKAQSSLQTLAM